MLIDGATTLDPDDFKITPRTQTNTRRALSGKVYGTRLEQRDELEITYDRLSHAQATTLLAWFYEHTRKDSLSMVFDRASSSDTQACTDGFSGLVEYADTRSQLEVDPNLSGDLTFTFFVDSYETF